MTPDINSRADAYVHGLLSAAEKNQFEQDLNNDSALRQALEEARRRWSLLAAALPPVEASEPLVQATLQRIGGHIERRKRWRRRIYVGMMAPLAAAALLLAFFHVHYENLSASPINLEVYGQSQLMPGSNGALCIRL